MGPVPPVNFLDSCPVKGPQPLPSTCCTEESHSLRATTIISCSGVLLQDVCMCDSEAPPSGCQASVLNSTEERGWGLLQDVPASAWERHLSFSPAPSWIGKWGVGGFGLVSATLSWKIMNIPINSNSRKQLAGGETECWRWSTGRYLAEAGCSWKPSWSFWKTRVPQKDIKTMP